MADIWNLVRENVKQIKPYSPGKSSKEVMDELGITEVTKLASNENSLGPSPRALEAMAKVLCDSHIYPDPTWAELRTALGEFYDMDPAGILIGRGSDEIIHMIGLALLNAGEEVIYSMPPFALYPFTATLMDCKHVTVPSKNHVHDLDAILAAITPKTKLIFVANPCNPTGTIVKQDAVDNFMAQVPDHCFVVFDEAYMEYVEDPQYACTLKYAREGRFCMTLNTFSKAYGLAGLRVGYGMAHPDVAAAIKLTCEPFNVSIVAQAAAIAALADREHVEKSIAMNRAGKKQMYAAFESMGLEYLPTEANFIFVNVGINSVECFDKLMRRGVTVRTGEIFNYHDWIRVTIGTEAENSRFLSALQDVLNK